MTEFTGVANVTENAGGSVADDPHTLPFMRNLHAQGQRPCLKSRKGSSSALIILLLVLLVFLGVLSLVSVHADYKLANRRAEWQQAYYQTDAAAQEVLALLNETLAGYQQALPEDQTLVAEDMEALMLNRVSSWNLAHDTQIRREESLIVLDSDIGATREVQPGQQMIHMTVQLETAADQPQYGRLTVVSWNQWQQPLTASTETGVVWQG